MDHRSTAELEAAVPSFRAAPKDEGRVVLVLRRPSEGERDILDVARLTFADGVEGDTWKSRGSRRTDDGSAHPDMQLNVMNARFAEFVAGSEERMALAGDQLYLDLDIGPGNAPPGTRISLGTAEIEITDQPHTGCAKFVQRFGLDAQRFVNSDVGLSIKARGVNAKVVVEGDVSPGDRAIVVHRPD